MELDRLMKFRNLSPNTMHMYSYYITKLFEYTDCDDTDNLTPRMAQDHVIYLMNRKKNPYAPRSANVVIGAYRYFFDAVLNIPLSRRMFPNLQLDYDDPYIFTKDQILALLQTGDVRMRAIILLGFDCGLRACETASLRISDIDSKKMLIRIRRSKRRKSRVVKLSDAVLNALRTYWKLYKPDDYFFPSPDHTAHVKPACINRWFFKYLKGFDFFDPQIHYHNLRHTFATNMLDNGCDIFVLKDLMGHSSLATTARYIHLATSSIEEAPSLSNSWGIH